jgi:hypothetical protein
MSRGVSEYDGSLAMRVVSEWSYTYINPLR